MVSSRRALGVLVGIMVIGAACGGDDSDDDEASAAEGSETAEGVAEVADPERCDLGFNTDAFNEVAEAHEPHSHDDTEESTANFTVEEWADVFVQPDHPLSDGVSREDVVAYINDDEALKGAVLSGGVGEELEPNSWMPMTDSEECQQLADELEVTRQVVAKRPTAQDAMDAGYSLVASYVPGIAAHYIDFGLLDDTFELDKPEMLLYDGNGPDANVAGMSYAVQSADEPPEAGFSSPNHHWHRHLGLCVKDGEVVGGTNLTEEQCADLGGVKFEGVQTWMDHVWTVPGCENEWGLFSGANPALVLRGDNADEPTEPGCGTGQAPDGEPGFDGSGNGPRL